MLQILALVFGLVIWTNAQEAKLTGTVYDRNGAVIPGAMIKLKTKSGKVYRAETNAEGIYQHSVPAIEVFLIEVTAYGFEKFRIKTYKLIPSSSGKQFLDIVLDLSGKRVSWNN